MEVRRVMREKSGEGFAGEQGKPEESPCSIRSGRGVRRDVVSWWVGREPEAEIPSGQRLLSVESQRGAGESAAAANEELGKRRWGPSRRLDYDENRLQLAMLLLLRSASNGVGA